MNDIGMEKILCKKKVKILKLRKKNVEFKKKKKWSAGCILCLLEKDDIEPAGTRSTKVTNEKDKGELRMISVTRQWEGGNREARKGMEEGREEKEFDQVGSGCIWNGRMEWMRVRKG